MSKKIIVKLRELYCKPTFSHYEKKKFFSTSVFEEGVWDQMYKDANRAILLLQIGIFNKYQRFIDFEELSDLHDILSYIAQEHFSHVRHMDFRISKSAFDKQKDIVLTRLGYRKFSGKTSNVIKKLLKEESNYYISPELLAIKCIDFLKHKKIAYPNRPQQLEKLIFEAIKTMKTAHYARFGKLGKRATKKLLKHFHDKELISSLKKYPKNFSVRQVKFEISRKKDILPVADLIKEHIESVGVSEANLKRYAEVFVSKYNAKTIKQNSEGLLIFSSFCLYRLKKLNDYLINAYNHFIRKFEKEAKDYAIQELLKIQNVGENMLTKLPDVLDLIIDPEISVDTPIKDIRKRAYKILSKKKIEEISSLLRDKQNDQSFFEKEFYKKNKNRINNVLIPILKALKLQSNSGRLGLLDKAISFGKKGQEIIMDVFKKIKTYLEKGEIYQNESLSYKELTKDIIDDERYRREKKKLIKNSHLPILATPIERHLDDLEVELESLIKDTNSELKAGILQNVTADGQGSFKISKIKGQKEKKDKNVLEYVDEASISRVVQMALKSTNFDRCFTHYANDRSAEIPAPLMTAVLVAIGTNLGIHKMSNICDFGYPQLKNILASYIRPDTLKVANAQLCNAVQKLPIFEYYYLEDGMIYSSSDGQKYETQFETVISRYSSKDFGMGKGVSDYSLIANNVPINTDVFSANEYEGHHVFDLQKNNITDIIPKTHCTDGHGVNPVNFAILNIFEKQFAPRIAGIASGKVKLYGFDYPSNYKNLEIRPTKKINRELIIENWDEITKIMLSLGETRVSQAVITRKLSQNSKSSPVKKALWEYNNILRSIFILNYVRSPVLRQNIQKSLNRGENYNQLKRNIAFANYGSLKGKTSYELEVWSECARLLANCIIYYNSVLLSDCLNGQFGEDDSDLFRCMVETSSPIAWSHINFFGRYEFRDLDNIFFYKDLINNNFYQNILLGGN
jgi:TnpA family transposase